MMLQVAVIGIAVLAYALVSAATHTTVTAQGVGGSDASFTLEAELAEAENDQLAGVLVEPSDTPTPSNTPTATNTPTPSPTPSPTHTPTATPFLVTAQPTVIPAGAEVAAPTPAPLREFAPNVVNVLLIGSDNRPGDTTWRSDVIIVASIDPDVPSLTMLSIPRDTWVYIPGWRWQRINLAYGRGEAAGFPGGGKELLKQTIQYNFGVPIHYIARVDFNGYKHMIDAVGGVDVIANCSLYDIFPDVPEGANDIISGPELSTVLTGTIDIPVAGVYHLDGKHALWYARSRKTTSDFDRSRRQQRVLRALWVAIQKQGLIQNLPGLWDSMTETIYTDLSLNDVLYLADVGLKIKPAQMRSRFIDGSMLTWFVTEGGANVLRYNYNEIEPYLDETFAPLPANIAAQASTWVDVRNGTSHPDWDLVAVDRLGWEGYDVYSWGAADQVYEHSILIDHSPSPKGSRAEALAEIFGVPPENIIRQPDADSAFAARVIVGEDWDPCQRPSRGRFPPPPPAPTATPGPAAVPPEAITPPDAPPQVTPAP
jgi:LCP family protein required for cell wall assembly